MRGAGRDGMLAVAGGLGIAAAIFAPGLSPYFIFPALGGGAAVAADARRRTRRGAVPVGAGDDDGLAGTGGRRRGDHGAGGAIRCSRSRRRMALTALLPVLAAQKMGEGAWRASVILSLMIALGAAVVAGICSPPYSAAQPERLNLRYVEKDGKSWWLADPVAPSAGPLARRGALSRRRPRPLAAWRGYVAPLGITQFPAPSATVTRQGNRVTLDLHGSAAADGMALMVSGRPAQLSASADVRCGGRPMAGVIITCATPRLRHCAYGVGFFRAGAQKPAAGGAALWPAARCGGRWRGRGPIGRCRQAGRCDLIADDVRCRRLHRRRDR